MTKDEEEYEHIPLFHGMRSKKSAEQIEKEGFCSYGSPEEGKKNVIDALKYFGKDYAPQRDLFEQFGIGVSA